MLKVYLTMGPLMLGGIANMVFTKTKFYKKYKMPIDRGKTAWDGKPIFGPNKTWIGFASMIVFCILFQLLCGLCCGAFGWEKYNDLYRCQPNTLWLNLIFGALVGAVYMICELPNSFIKRRIGIKAGKTDSGIKGAVFFVVDQIDSIVGVMLVLAAFTDIGVAGYFKYVAFGGLTHIGVNLLLFALKIRRNI